MEKARKPTINDMSRTLSHHITARAPSCSDATAVSLAECRASVRSASHRICLPDDEELTIAQVLLSIS